MEWINPHNVLIVGLGLIGGSYAKALKSMGYHIIGINRSREALDYALENNIIDEGGSLDDRELIAKADCIIISLYPGIIVDWVQNNQDSFRTGIRITDVSGIKSAIVYDIQRVLREDCEFIAAHPMAGREVSGVTNSDERIFRDANYIVVPTEKNTPEAIEWCMVLGKILGFSNISVLSPEEHDSMIAYVSQLTHCIAVALMTCNDNEHVKDYTGDSFRDLTRIARINENMWPELFHLNKNALLQQMDLFMKELGTIREMIATDDEEGLKDKMRLSTARRERFNKKK